MEHLTLTPDQPNYRKFQDEIDKSFYAAYLNTAKQNVFIILKDISDRLELKFVNNDDSMLKAELWTKLNRNDQPELTQNIVEKLERQFTFLNIIAKNNAYMHRNGIESEPNHQDYYTVLQIWIEQLLNYRNYYTHAEHKPVNMNPSILDGMRVLYDADWKEFKDRKSLSMRDTDHLIRLGKNGERTDFKYGFTDANVLTEKGFLYFLCL